MDGIAGYPLKYGGYNRNRTIYHIDGIHIWLVIDQGTGTANGGKAAVFHNDGSTSGFADHDRVSIDHRLFHGNCCIINHPGSYFGTDDLITGY